MSWRERISRVDTAWLRMDRPENLMQILGVMIFKDRIDHERAKRTIAQRIVRYRRFHQIATTDGNWWIDDDNFDIDAHVRHSLLPAPGGPAELQKFVAQLASMPLAAARPRWQFHLVDTADGRSAAVLRIHHAIADGISLLGVIDWLTDEEKDAPEAGRAIARSDAQASDGDVLRRSFGEPLGKLMLASIHFGGQLWGQYLGLRNDPAALREYGRVAATWTADIGKLALMPEDSPTRFKGKASSVKHVAWSQPIALADIKAVGKVLGCSVNDTLLSVVAGALGSYLVAKGDPVVSDTQIRAMVPVNLRAPDDVDDLGNRFGLVALELPIAIDNPLAQYPNRDWERAYRDLFKPDESFVFLCAPNDTHNCILNAHVRNGVVTRIGPTMRYGEAKDLAGNGTTHRWDPRVCQKGLALTRRFYGDRRVNQCMVRAGFKRWYEAGFPRESDGKPPVEYFQRARDEWVRMSHDEAAKIVAAALKNIAETYTGEAGKERLKKQHYDEATIEATKGVGTQVLKFRGGMPLLGITRVFGMYRMANSMALLDAHIRKVGPDQALGGRGFDNYSWHTDLPPGHPMVTGQQTVEFDLNSVEHAKTVVVWGMNWITTKMPDAHWLTEARLKGTRIIVIACEYSATATKGDDVLVVRPGTTPALALGFAHVIMRDHLYDQEYVRQWTDLPVLVRMDTLKYLRAEEVTGQKPGQLKNYIQLLKEGEKEPPAATHTGHVIPEKMRQEWGDFLWWDRASNSPKPITRDEVGKTSNIGDALLEGTVEVQLADGKKVRCRPVYDLVKEYAAHFDPKTVEELTWAPAHAVESLARHFAKDPGTTLFAIGMGPNQFFNNDNKDRDIFLLAALTGNVGKIGGNVGSYAGNYRVALFNGSPQYINENPFDIELDPNKLARPKQYWKAESAHYYNHEDHPLRVGNKLLTGSTHIPTPTKSLWFANANSIL
ncbi:MAG TPA: wax ester/triacylglycerol synthase family O-acyltransferase, partial [Accumulibacter sp.]|nr:wax ester/triacylglycerol synthase family O-acyltransferase [Accumulibacter sp.]